MIEVKKESLTCAVTRETAEMLLGKIQVADGAELSQADFDRLLKTLDRSRAFIRLINQAMIGIWPVRFGHDGFEISNGADDALALTKEIGVLLKSRSD